MAIQFEQPPTREAVLLERVTVVSILVLTVAAPLAVAWRLLKGGW